MVDDGQNPAAAEPWPENKSTEAAQSFLGPAERIGRYRILRLVGSGGMGDVYEAEQEAPIRRVALKLIKLGMDTRQVVARFESERQALALMNHANIARVFDAGSTDKGRPYFVMEFVPGLPITDYCDQERLSSRERLDLFIQVCEGVQHAHQKGIIHRDLKPWNILVMLQNDGPVPKIIDFGVAKATGQRLTERTLVTQFGGPIGTPAYMSPEQADITCLDVDTRSDVYSLGVLLYTLLVGMLPIDCGESKSLEETLRRIRDEDPPRPSVCLSTLGAAAGAVVRSRRTTLPLLLRELRRDLDWIVIKAIEKNRARRYQTASELAADVLRHLRNEPVQARPPSVRYRLGKFVRRHRAGVAAASLVVLVLLLGFVAVTTLLVRARRAEDVAQREAATAKQVSEFLEELFQVADPGEARGNEVTAREILDRESRRIASEMREQPLVQARLMGTVGRLYMRRGLYDEARPLLEQAHSISRRALGENQADVAMALNNLAILLRNTGDYDGALEAFQRALSIAEKTLSADDPDLAYIMNGTGLTLRDRGDYAAARPLLERALAIREQNPGPNSSYLTQSLNNLALLLSDMGDFVRARPLYARALETDEKALGPDHLSVANDLNDLAMLEHKAGAPAKARSLYERALAIREKVLGPEHPAVADTLNNLADQLLKTGDPAGARPFFERALAIYEKAVGPDHPYVAGILSNLATSLRKTGDLAGARPLFERALAVSQKALGPDHPFVAAVSRDFAAWFEDAGDYESARTLYEKALAIGKRAQGPDHPDVAETLTAYAGMLRKSGRSAEAEALEARATAPARPPG